MDYPLLAVLLGNLRDLHEGLGGHLAARAAEPYGKKVFLPLLYEPARLQVVEVYLLADAFKVHIDPGRLIFYKMVGHNYQKLLLMKSVAGPQFSPVTVIIYQYILTKTAREG